MDSGKGVPATGFKAEVKGQHKVVNSSLSLYVLWGLNQGNSFASAKDPCPLLHLTSHLRLF